MAGYGITQEDIAIVLGIDRKTLAKHFRRELDEGKAVANVQIGRSLYDQATGRPAEFDAHGRVVREELKPDKSVAIFMGKARLGMRDTQRVEHTGAPGTINLVDLDLTILDDDELATFMGLYRKILRSSVDVPHDTDGDELAGLTPASGAQH